MDEGVFVTIVGKNFFEKSKKLMVGDIILIVKDYDNQFDDEAIAVLMKDVGQIGYIANSTHTVARGTRSAGRIYDSFGDFSYGIVKFILKDNAIVELLNHHEFLLEMEDFKLEVDFLSSKNAKNNLI